MRPVTDSVRPPTPCASWGHARSQLTLWVESIPLMIDRIVEIASPARLSIRDAQLVIERPQAEQLVLPFTTPISEIAVLLLAHPQVTLSQAVLSRIAEAGGSVVTIDGHFLPASIQLPVQAHSLQTERFAKQMQLSLPANKRLWQQIVRAKIRAQGELLK